MKHQSSRLDRGFTIIEVMVAMVVLAIGLLGMAGMTLMVIKGGTDASRMTYATNLAADKIESLKDVAWLSLGGYTGTCTYNESLSNWSGASGYKALALPTGCDNNEIMIEEELNQQGAYCREDAANKPCFFTRRWVICQPSEVSVSDSSDACNLTGRIPELACTSGEVATKQKKIKMVVSWRDKSGRCHFISMTTVQVDLG